MKTADAGFDQATQRKQARTLMREARAQGIGISHQTARQLVNRYARLQRQVHRTEREAGE